ncbi:T9SS type A sorting domain-containing protein [Paracrocinitomix mangrovi]|uniref:T9SS type A sorting domain-containing protein n=1 Tax=Paracrocinitomix mangrovi TaxID=2862509 RepID=UPI001C8D183C|nr:T9SS type A sorting domain-containing protein [Paracrocinitomix mangrovi]UKN02396.1 T9SS type A sorting domain-containing protein [Paracrocinitomix mangrovi]
MNKFLLTLILCAGFATIGFNQANNYSNGATVADFTVTDTQGNTHNLYTITASGKYVFVDFFFDTCGPCQQTQPFYNELHDKYGCNAGDLYVISINNGTDSDAEVDAFEATYGGTFNHAPAVSADGGGGAVTSAFGVGAFPTYCLIGPDNKMVQNDVWPISDVSTFEAAFPSGFNPTVMACSAASIVNNSIEKLTVYPNPANDVLNINFETTVAATATIEIVNMLGAVVISEDINTTNGSNQHVLNVNDLSSGQYVARINSGTQLTTVKFNKL